MANQELVNFLKEEAKANVPLEAMKESLKKAGWSEADINEALEAAGISYSSPQPASQSAGAIPKPSQNKSGKSILLIDDEKDFRDIVAAKLGASGFQVLEAEGGQQGLDVLKQAKPDLVLLDVQMPNMDGAETLSRIRSDPATRNEKVVFLTNYEEPLPVGDLSANDKKFAQEAGAFDYLQKSKGLDEIVKSVQGFLRR